MKVELLAVTKPLSGYNIHELIEYAGRVCTNTTDKVGKATGAFLEARKKQGHLSIFEHVSLTFEISEISRACSHQLVRHRIASYSQQSMRYVAQIDLDYVVPDSIQQNEETVDIYEAAMWSAWVSYEALIAQGIKKEDARFVLPIATKTRIVMTMNLRELMHFIEVRTSPAAQWEIRAVALEIKAIIADL